MNQAQFETHVDRYEDDKDVMLFLAAVESIPDHPHAKERKLAAWAIEQMKTAES